MRILQVGPVPPEVGGSTRGGVASHLWGLATYLAKRGHQVAILADNYRPSVNWSVMRNSVAIYGVEQAIKMQQKVRVLNPFIWSKIIRTKRHFGPLVTWQGVATNLTLYHQVIKDFQPEVIHVNHLEIRFPFTYFSSGCKIPIVTTIHSSTAIEFNKSSNTELIQNLVKNNLGLSNNLIFVSNFVKQRFESLFPGMLNECNTWVISNPVDSSKFYPISKKSSRKLLGKEIDKPQILFVGKLKPLKGSNLLIQAVSLLKDRGLDLQLMIVGDGPEKSKLDEFIKRNALGGFVSLEGPKDYNKLLNYYNAADLFVLPSASEGFSLVYLEAMLCGCPVIGTKGVADESIPSTEFGYLVPPNDAYALAELIEKGLKREWDKESIVSHARLFEWNERITDFEDVYRNITQKGKQSHG
ncbi:D-inositol 3-phosphate glycosyltransferase [subsurface metagenome]